MAYVVGKLRADDLNTDQARITALETRVGVILRRAASQSINNNSATNISWDTADEQLPSDFVAVHATTGTTLTVPSGAGGLYSISLFVNSPSLSAATRVFASLNFTGLGTGYPSFWRGQSNSTEDDVWCSVSDIYLPDAATVIADYYHNEGSAQNITAWLSMHRRQE